MKHRDYSFLGTTQSLCPECLRLVTAKIVVRHDRVYFRKSCPEHGVREDFVCSDVSWYDRNEHAAPARLPEIFGVEPVHGCPFDCGLCSDHEQHTCVGLVELTDTCNLTCPLCYASSSPAGRHRSTEDCRRAIDRLVEVEGRAEVLQLSGGEPTLHPDFAELVEYAVGLPIDYVMVNTNGIRFAHDPALLERLSVHRDRLEIYFQLDGLDDDVSLALRGERLLDVKLRALEGLQKAGLHVTLAVTLQGGVNEEQLGPLVKFAVDRPWITGISFQPATYSGRYVLPEELERRITFPDVVKGICRQTEGMFRETDFLPLPCAHPNCHILSYAWRRDGRFVPLTRFLPVEENMDLLANGITFTRARASRIIQQYLGRSGCCGPGGCDERPAAGEPSLVQIASVKESGQSTPLLDPETTALAFLERAAGGQLGADDVFRITITSFLDAYNFDVRRVMKCCTHHVLPSGHVIPFCAYNVLYREGHVPLPEIGVAAHG